MMWLGKPPRIYAYTGGKPFDAALPTVVMLHGGQHDHSVWILQSRYLAHHGFGVLALDLPAHGRSDGAVADSIEAAAERVVSALQAAGAERLLLVGHSMGALIALEVAKRMPTNVAGVALIAIAFPMAVSDALLKATREHSELAMQMINVWSHSPSVSAATSKPNNPGPGFSNIWGNLRLMQQIERRNGAEVLAADFAACNDYRGGIDAARGLQCPALFVLGERDSMTPARNARDLIAACRDAAVVTLPAGHSLMAEAPDGVRLALLDFARKVFSAA